METKKLYTKKIILLKKTFLKDNFQEIIKSITFIRFLDYMTFKQIKDFCYLYRFKGKQEECLIECILRTKIIDGINNWEIGQATKDLFAPKKQLLLKGKGND